MIKWVKKIPELAFNIPNKSIELNNIQKRNNIVNNFVNLANFTKHKVPPFGADINEN